MANDSSADTQVVESKSIDIHPHVFKAANNHKITSVTDTQAPLKRPASESSDTLAQPHSRSPTKKVRLEVPPNHHQATIDQSKAIPKSVKFVKNKFIYGNYNRYYGYRNVAEAEDVRLVAFKHYMEFFEEAEILDIGCNYGNVTAKIAKEFPIKHIVGIDIDKSLIALARKRVISDRKAVLDGTKTNSYPFNVTFNQCNYVISDENLLPLETEQFDTMLCLSVTKWVHLNFGDAGLKMAFKRMFRQLRPGGRLILEPQDWRSYKKRKNLTQEIRENYRSIKLFPSQFREYLMSAEVGFEHCFEMQRQDHEIKGFRRPIYVFQKAKLESEAQNS